MNLNKGLSIVAAAAIAGGLSTSAFAADASYACVGAADDAGIAACIATASLDGATCSLSGSCVVTTFTIINAPITLQGPARISRANGSGIGLRAGASGAVIQDLTIDAPIGNAITNNAPALPFHQPDDVTIRRNTLIGVRGIQQFSMNAPPFNDVDRASGLPAGIVNGWVITDNDIEALTANGIGALITGNDNVIANNRFKVQRRALAFQNNVNSAAAAPFGSAPGDANNLVWHNVILSDLTLPGATFYPVGGSDFGYDYFALLPEGPNHRGTDNRWVGNCFTVQDSSGAFNFSVGMQHQLAGGSTYDKNNLQLGVGPNGIDGGNSGLVSFGMQASSFSKNDIGGAADYAMASLDGSEINNLFDGNKIGAVTGLAGFGVIAVDFGPDSSQPNVYRGTKYCTGDLYLLGPGSVDGGNNDAGHFCSQGAGQLSPAHECVRGLGYAGKSLGQPVSGTPGQRMVPEPNFQVEVSPADLGDQVVSPVSTRLRRVDGPRTR